jgi:hypothetical protein
MSGRNCANGACVERNAFCDQACASRGGWTPNPQGCYSWVVSSGNSGTGANYTSSRSGCTSGYSISIERPGSTSSFAWCIPANPVCTGAADCPQNWSCADPVTGPVGTSGTYRFCLPPLTGAEAGTFCNRK